MRSPRTLPASSRSDRGRRDCDVRPESLRFEPVGPEHAGALAELFERNAVAAVVRGFDPFPLTAETASWIALHRHRDAYYLATCDRRAIGISMLRGFDEGYDIPSFGIFIDHLSHGRGIGRRLTVWTIDRARLQGCRAVRLSVYDDNPVARALYTSLGFVEQERLPARRGDVAVEKIVMRLELGG
jgi:GNAT superfamily N-acetyltransferase